MSTERQDRRRAERVTVDWAARLETEEGRVREGPVADVSTIGLRFISDGEPVTSDTAGTLTVTFIGPDHRMDVVKVHARVVWSAESSVAVSYAGLPDPAARRLRARFLSSESRRRTPRVRVAVPVEVRFADGTSMPGGTVDLSAFAARVSTPTPLDPGARVQLVIFPEDGKSLVLAAVVWETQDLESVLMFTNLSPRDFDRIGDWVVTFLHERG